MSEVEKIAVLETKVAALEKTMCDIAEAVKEIKDKLLGRPSWQITAVISTLTAICGSSIMFIINILI